MKPNELKETIAIKTAELQLAIDLERPYAEQSKLYKELKELQFTLVQAELQEAHQEE
jgi:hypothetical protein